MTNQQTNLGLGGGGGDPSSSRLSAPSPGPCFVEAGMENGWIKLHRKITDWEWYSDVNTTRLFIHILLTANHAPKKWRGITVSRGQRVIGTRSLVAETHLSRQSLRTSLERLKSTHEITIQSTRHFSVVTVCNYEAYQSKEKRSNPQSNQQANPRLTHDQPTLNPQVTTNKNEKDERMEEIDAGAVASAPAIAPVKKTNGWEITNDFLEELRADITYRGIDIGRELGKMQAWCRTHRKHPTQRRFVNWLNNAEPTVAGVIGATPIAAARPKPKLPAGEFWEGVAKITGQEVATK